MLKEALIYFLIAFALCSVLIIISQLVLRNILKRPVDYYDNKSLSIGEKTGTNDNAIESKPEPELKLEPESRPESVSEKEKKTELDDGNEVHENISEIPETIDEEPAVEEMYAEMETQITEQTAEQNESKEKNEESNPFDKEDIRKQLEKAFDDKIKRVKPSMKLKKAELKAIAEYRGIEVPSKATKQVILDLIKSTEENKEEE